MFALKCRDGMAISSPLDATALPLADGSPSRSVVSSHGERKRGNGNVSKRKSLADLQRRTDLHLLPHFRGWRAAQITTADVRRYTAARQQAGDANAQINRELAALKRAYTLATQGGKVLVRPHIPMLQERNVRKGFFEAEQSPRCASTSLPRSKPSCRSPT
jgi:hypothetical protein